MTWFKKALALVLAVSWLLAMNHCKLENLPGLSFLVCCDHEDAAPHQDDDCETDGCATVENQLYKTENAQVSVTAPTLLFAIFLSPPWTALSAPSIASRILPDAAPVVLTRVWQFSYRTALPPRAPSLLS